VLDFKRFSGLATVVGLRILTFDKIPANSLFLNEIPAIVKRSEPISIRLPAAAISVPGEKNWWP